MLEEPNTPVLDHQISTTDSENVRQPSLLRDKILLGTVIGAFAVDQLSKEIVRSSLSPHESWPSEGFFSITYGTNTGTAFGLLPNQTILLIVASVIAMGFLFYFYRTHAMPSRLLRFAVGLQLGGAFGNLIDRVLAGEVVDFIDVGPWPIFNLADSSIVVGIFILITTFLFTKESKVEEPDEVAHEKSDTAEASPLTHSSAQDE